ncbi:MAG: hypothetical protein GTO41_18915, partial [Burkholderiales bacterium]|nr:hypothetical protein [Burkholderiales bacterium]
MAGGTSFARRQLLFAESGNVREVAIMFFLLKRYASMLLFVVLFGWLAGCATTETGSEAVIEDLSVDEAVAQEDSELFISETETPAGSTV